MQTVYDSLKAFLDHLLGTYIPVTYNADGVDIVALGAAGVDWPYIVRAAVFLVLLWSLFRILGGIICR